MIKSKKLKNATEQTINQSPFERVYAVVAKIPKGKVMTYGQVAKVAGVANARVVGFAMRCNKDTNTVPCHRVVGSDGRLTGYAYGGLKMKRALLEREGVIFKENDLVDLSLSQYMWI